MPYEDSAQKYDDYLLDKNHIVGGSKAKFLSETLGYNEGDGAKLHAAISEAINGKNQMKSLQLNMELRQRFILQLKAMMANITLQTLQLSFKKTKGRLRGESLPLFQERNNINDINYGII